VAWPTLILWRCLDRHDRILSYFGRSPARRNLFLCASRDSGITGWQKSPKCVHQMLTFTVKKLLFILFQCMYFSNLEMILFLRGTNI
jgi:hypothetical protein